MAYEQRDGSGSLFKNDRKEQDNHPAYQGSITVGGVAYWIKGWIKDGAKGKWMSLAVTPKEGDRTIPIARTDGRQVTARRSSADMGRDELNDEIPW